MKKTIIQRLLSILFLAAAVSTACAQGTVTFNTFNSNTALGQCFLVPELGGGGPGTNYYGQLWWSDTSNGVFAPAGTPQTFNANTYVLDGSVAIPGRAGGAQVFIQMRVWNVSAGADWCTAIGDPPGSNPSLAGSGITQTTSRILGGISPDGYPFTPQQYNNFINLTISPLNPLPPCTSAPAPPALVFFNAGGSLILSWNGPFILQSAPNVTGVYSDVLVSRIPHTNDVSSATQKFFRLRY